MNRELILKSTRFHMYRRKVQRKKGRAKNQYVISVHGVVDPALTLELRAMHDIMKSHNGIPNGLFSRYFIKKEHAEKAWIHLVLRYG